MLVSAGSLFQMRIVFSLAEAGNAVELSPIATNLYMALTVLLCSISFIGDHILTVYNLKKETISLLFKFFLSQLDFVVSLHQ